MSIKLDLKDRKILYELDKNCRQSNAEIGKKVGLKRDTVMYRINKLIEKGVIKNFIIDVNLAKLGFIGIKIYFQFQGLTEQKEKEIIDFFIKNKKINWVGKCEGAWDLFFRISVRDIFEFNDFKKEIDYKFGKYISKKTIAIMVDTLEFRREYFLNKKISQQKEIFLVKKAEPEKLKKYDIEILKFLSENARLSNSEIAHKLGISRLTVSSRIKELQKKEILLGFTTSFDLEKFDYHFFKSFITLHNTSLPSYKRFLTYCKLNPNIIHVVETIGDWEIEPEFEVSSNKEFYETIRDIRNKFPDIIKGIETVLITKEFKHQLLPDI